MKAPATLLLEPAAEDWARFQDELDGCRGPCPTCPRFADDCDGRRTVDNVKSAGKEAAPAKSGA